MPRQTSRSGLIAVIAAVVLVALGVWAVSVRSRPAFAVYDTIPAAVRQDSLGIPGTADTVRVTAPVSGTPQPVASEPGRAGSSASTTAVPRTHKPVATSPADSVPPSDSSVADSAARRPHRSDNYGGYSGYGSRERRGDTHAR